jgi:hypothetical protein
MRSYRYIRSLIRASVYVAASLVVPVSFGAAADQRQVQAQLLDHAELLCANCFFGTSDYYYCFAADDKVLIGYQRTPVLNWIDKSKNYLTRVHRGWTAWTAPVQTLPIGYDDKHIWVTREDGKQVTLTQSYSRDIFTGNDRCRDAVRAKAH